MEIGESGNAFGQENASEATGLELSGESAGIGDLQDNMDSRIGSETEGAASMGDGAVGSGTSSYGGTQESSVSGLSADNFDTGTMEHMDGTGAVSGMEPAADSSGRVSGLEAAESGQNLPVGDSTGFAAGESAVNSVIDTAVISGKAGGSAAVTGVSQQDGMSEGLRGCYQAERDGKQYMRYDTGLYEKPKGPYQTIHENGKTYYELPKQEKAPAMLPETKAVLEKNGTLRLEKVYQQKERMEKPKEQPALQESLLKQREKKAIKKPVKKQTGAGLRNQRRKTPDKK